MTSVRVSGYLCNVQFCRIKTSPAQHVHGDLGFYNKLSVDRTPTHNTHLCSTVCSQARNAHRALGSSHTDCSVICVRLKKDLFIWCRTCLTLCCSLTCRLPRAHHLPHSLFLPPLHKNTQHNRFNMVTSKNTRCITHISRLPQSTSSAIKNHSDVKTMQSGGNPRTTTPTVTKGSTPYVVENTVVKVIESWPSAG